MKFLDKDLHRFYSYSRDNKYLDRSIRDRVSHQSNFKIKSIIKPTFYHVFFSENMPMSNQLTDNIFDYFLDITYRKL